LAQSNILRSQSTGRGKRPTNGPIAMTTPRAILFVLAVGLTLGVETALAHAIVVASTPLAHQTISQSELMVEIRFNSRVDPARSRLTLVRPNSASVILPLMGSGPSETLKASASGLENGRYRLMWQTLRAESDQPVS
jgi:hypothetical protein